MRFDDGGVTVVADLPKKVEWDQEQLAATVERIRASGDDPAEYVDLAFKVPERKYGAWPGHIRTAFEAARTVKAGNADFNRRMEELEQAARSGDILATPVLFGTVTLLEASRHGE